MLSRDDLPGRMSPAQSLHHLQQRLLTSSCATSSAIQRFLADARLRHGRVVRYARNLFIGVSIPAALVLGSALPQARPSLPLEPVAATFALQGALSAFAGDLAVPEVATADEFIFSADAGLAAPVSAGRFVPVTVEVANLRSGPGTSYERIGKLRQGQTVKLLGRNGDWFKVETSSGQTGWIHSELVSASQQVIGSLTTIEVPAASTTSRIIVGATTEENVNLRSGPGTTYESLGKLPAGTKLEVIGQREGWYRVATANGTVGWVSASFFSIGGTPRLSTPAASGPIVGSVAANRVNLRQGPSTAFGSFGKMAAGVQLEVLAQHGGWYKVRSPRGTIGWVAQELVNLSPEAAKRVPVTNDVPAAPKPVKAVPAASAAGALGYQAAQLALKFVGARYVYGGASPRGFDCSGLTSYVYRQLGVHLPHKASAQFSTRYGQRVSFGELAPGDLVFFANTAGPGITHVALYVGNGMMVSANTPRTGVQYVSIHGSYWRRHFAGAIRPYR
ncbi:SH3 domain-containing protein [Kallotenue papyrolyticum]|uniref:SH3 domain-containing protein n=1 Tax=Kallotenue papyrolyticum TaxID=1325125 RepID=UPI000492D5E1|nr:C40 family peptidase [Kallotenue papyrolyticum]